MTCQMRSSSIAQTTMEPMQAQAMQLCRLSSEATLAELGFDLLVPRSPLALSLRVLRGRSTRRASASGLRGSSASGRRCGRLCSTAGRRDVRMLLLLRCDVAVDCVLRCDVGPQVDCVLRCDVAGLSRQNPAGCSALPRRSSARGSGYAALRSSAADDATPA